MTRQKLGQHFLASDEVIKKIIQTSGITSSDTVLEVGPGKGVLTFALARHARRVLAIEKDETLMKHLREKITKEHITNCEIIRADIRDFRSLERILGDTQYILIGNIPYYITAYLFQKFLQEERLQPSKIIFMVQKEVAERIVSKEPKHTLLSVPIAAYGTPKLLFYVSRNLFFPPPDVDSAVIVVSDISRGRFLKNNVSEEYFFKVLRAGFRQPRKFLLNNLSDILNVSKSVLENLFQTIGINKKARAGELSILEWFQLSKSLIRS